MAIQALKIRWGYLNKAAPIKSYHKKIFKSRTLAKRTQKTKKVYEKAKAKYPERWNSRSVRNWDREEKVYLNYLQKDRESGMKKVS